VERLGVAPGRIGPERPEKYRRTWLGLHFESAFVMRKMSLAVREIVIEVHEERGRSLTSTILKVETGLGVLTTRVVVAAIVRPGLVPDDLDVLTILKRTTREFAGPPKDLLGGRMLL